MDITSIELWTLPNSGISTRHATLSLDPSAAQESYILKSATGLDPDEILNQFYAVRGTNLNPIKFYSLLPSARIVTFNIKLNPNYAEARTPSNLRDTLYKMISHDRTGDVQIRLMNADVIVGVLNGFVTRFESDLFNNDPTVTITFTCTHPFIRSLSRLEIGPSLSFPSIQFDDDISTAPHGFYMKIQLLSNISNPVIQGQGDLPNASPFAILYDFLADDILYFISEPDARALYIERAGDVIHLVDRVSLNSIWPLVFPGHNNITVFFNATIISFAHYLTYWGV